MKKVHVWFTISEMDWFTEHVIGIIYVTEQWLKCNVFRSMQYIGSASSACIFFGDLCCILTVANFYYQTVGKRANDKTQCVSVWKCKLNQSCQQYLMSVMCLVLALFYISHSLFYRILQKVRRKQVSCVFEVETSSYNS